MKNKYFFKIIIPCFNAENYIERCINSIEEQTFKDFIVIAVDDQSIDNTFNKVKELSKKYNNIICLTPTKKVWNGGARNIGIKYDINTEYTLFIDNDDWFESQDCLSYIYEAIKQNNYPDCIRLPYIHYKDGKKQSIMLTDDNPKDLVNSCFVAPWTKCIKSDKVVDFPENTLIEDVVQHIEQCDNIETVSICAKPIICWNRDNINACSREENKYRYNSKRISSIYRNIADLMDLQCEHDYCEEHRKWRIDCYKNLVKEGKEEHF